MATARKLPPPTGVLLVRHGVTPTTRRILPGRRPGRHLSDEGLRKAEKIKAVVAHALGAPLDLFQRIMIGTASITAIAYGRTNATVLTVNSSDGNLVSVLG